MAPKKLEAGRDGRGVYGGKLGVFLYSSNNIIVEKNEMIMKFSISR